MNKPISALQMSGLVFILFFFASNGSDLCPDTGCDEGADGEDCFSCAQNCAGAFCDNNY